MTDQYDDQSHDFVDNCMYEYVQNDHQFQQLSYVVQHTQLHSVMRTNRRHVSSRFPSPSHGSAVVNVDLAWQQQYQLVSGSYVPLMTSY